MNSKKRNIIKGFEIAVTMIILAGMLFPAPTLVMAQDENPPVPADTGGEAEPAGEAAEVPENAGAEEVPAAEPVDLPPEQTVETPIEPPAEEAIPTEQTVEIPEGLEAPEAPVIVAPPEEEAAPEPEKIEDIVAMMDETNTVLVNENNEEVPLASEEAAEVLAGADPFFLDPVSGLFIGYTSGSSCPSFVSECNTGQSAPFTAALNDARLTEYSTLYIEAATYNEPSIVLNRNLNLQGGTGWFTSGTGSGLTVGYTDAIATISYLTIGSNIGYFDNVVANSVFVDGGAVGSDVERGYLLDDALWVVNSGGTINLADGTYQDEGDGFLIEKNGVTLQGQGDGAVINGSNTGFGIYIDDYISGSVLQDTTIRRIKIIDSNYGISIGDAVNSNFDHLTLTGNGTGLYASEYAGNAAIHNSIILGNTNYGIYNASVSILDASVNYWGHALGPTFCWDAGGSVACDPTKKGDYVYANDGTNRNVITDGFLAHVVCPAGQFDSNSDGVCDVTVCPPGSYDANSDGECEATACPAGSFDANSDGMCEMTVCQPGTYDANSDGMCETTVCPPGSFDALASGVCLPTTCPAGYFDANSDGACEATVCPILTYDANSDGVCELTVCTPGTADANSDGACEATVCPILTYDANSDAVCERTICDPGTADVNSDGACEAVACEAGHFDVDSDNVCEAVDCPPGSYDSDSDGVCNVTICGVGLFDMNSDGRCEAVNCGPGTADVDSDGVCEETICKGGRYDVNSDGRCEDISYTVPMPQFYQVLGEGEIIPVTGDMVELSCVVANTLVLASGESVAFGSPLCGYMAGLSGISGSALPAPLPEGLTFVSGMTIVLQKDTENVAAIPETVTGTAAFAVPGDLSGKALQILMWNAQDGVWTKVSGGSGETGITATGSYVLAYE